jgi:hypothetical protein
LTAYVDALREARLKTFYWQKFFPLKPTISLTWESLSGSGGAPVMADVIEYNASAPIKTRRIVSKASGDIPKIAVKRKMDEKDYNDYLYYKAMAGTDAMKAALLDLIFDDVEFVWTGVQARTEFLALQALSCGAVKLTIENNNGIVTIADVDFGVPSGHKTAVTTVWSDANSSTPIADIRTKMADIKADGQYILMDEGTWFYMIATAEVRDAYSFYQGIATGRIAVPALDMVNNMLTAERLPSILIVNSVARFENRDHVLSSVTPWNAGYVAFIPTLEVGNVKHAPIAEENAETVKKISIGYKRDHVFINKWSELEPFGEFTKGQANAFPVFNDVESIYHLLTSDTSWDVPWNL